jgi:hypothetical protein
MAGGKARVMYWSCLFSILSSIFFIIGLVTPHWVEEHITPNFGLPMTVDSGLWKYCTTQTVGSFSDTECHTRSLSDCPTESDGASADDVRKCKEYYYGVQVLAAITTAVRTTVT